MDNARRNASLTQLEWIQSKVAQGFTVYIHIGAAALKFNRRNIAALVVLGSDLCIPRGKSWDCVIPLRISAVPSN